jgi:CheY-like chemotaxis protein
LEHKPYRILLCDDDPDEALFLETAFKNAGFRVDLEYFNRCSTLLDDLSSRREVPDLIFIDIHMPGENGLECLAQVKQFPSYKDVPVIIYSTSRLPKEITEAFDKGASLYLPKTASETEMIDMINYLLNLKQEELCRPNKENFYYCPRGKKS